MSALDEIPELILQASKFNYGNFASKGSNGYPNAFSEDWIVWTHHVEKVVEEIGAKSAAGAAIARGLNHNLLDFGNDHFESAINSIMSGLKAARRIYADRIPASDRVISLGHNSQLALEKVDEVIAAVTEANEFPGDEDDKEQIIAELSAARRILEAARVRVVALSSTLAPPLKWLLEKAAGSIVGKAANSAWEFFTSLNIFPH